MLLRSFHRFPLLFTLIALHATSAAAQHTIAFVDVSVVPMDRASILEHQTVLVRDGRIVSVTDSREAVPPKAAVVIRGEGKYLLPGLADMHVHFARDPDELLLYVANGVTTVRELSGEPLYLSWRRDVANGSRIGPRMLVATPILDAPTGRRPIVWRIGGTLSLAALLLAICFAVTRGRRKALLAFLSAMALATGYATMRYIVPFPDAIMPPSQVSHWWIGTPREAAANVRGAAGTYDLVKLYENLSPAEFHSAIGAARAAGLHTVAHVPFALTFDETLHSGLDELAHVYFLVQETQRRVDTTALATHAAREQALSVALRTIAQEVKASNVEVTSTLMPMPEVLERFTDTAAYWARPDHRYRTVAARRSLRALTAKAPDAQVVADVAMHVHWGGEAARELVRAGVPLVFGTDDAPFTSVAGFGAREELKLLRASGLSPYEVLRTATVNAAAVANASGRRGTIVAGRDADLLLLDGNPLLDLATINHPAGVMAAGRWLPRPVLDSLLNAVATRRRGP